MTSARDIPTWPVACTVPVGTPGALVEQRHWDDYDLGRADAIAHLERSDGSLSTAGTRTESRAAQQAAS